MRKASIFLSIFVQLVLGAIIGMMLYSFATGAVNNQGFVEEVYATDAAMLAETMMSRDDARLSLYHLYEDNSYTLTLTQRYARIQTSGSTGAGRAATLLHRREADIEEHEARGQTIQWLWFENKLRAQALSLARSCPALQVAREWEAAAAIGDYSGLAQNIIATAYYERGLADSTTQYPNSRIGDEDFTLEIVEGEELLIQAGEGDYNARLRCLAEQAFPEARVIQTTQRVDGARITAPDPREHQEAIVALLEEVVE